MWSYSNKLIWLHRVALTIYFIISATNNIVVWPNKPKDDRWARTRFPVIVYCKICHRGQRVNFNITETTIKSCRTLLDLRKTIKFDYNRYWLYYIRDDLIFYNTIFTNIRKCIIILPLIIKHIFSINYYRINSKKTNIQPGKNYNILNLI